MNKKILSCIMIVCTLITSAVIIYIFSYGSMNNNQSEEVTEVKNEKPQESHNAKSNETYKEPLNESKHVDKENKSSKDTVDKPTKKKEPIKESSEEGSSPKNSTKSIKKDDSKPVFKVNIETIGNSLSTTDKAKLLFIGNKLSTVDEGRIKEYLSYNNQEEGARKTYKLLKQRLNKEDFDKVKEILERYINIDVIEN